MVRVPSVGVFPQGIMQHNPAAYVLNNTLPKHRPMAAAAAVRVDGLHPAAGDPAAVRPTRRLHLPSLENLYFLCFVKRSKLT